MLKKLYTYFRSSAAYRVRIALAYKGVEIEQCAINLLAGEHSQGDYLARNPQGLVPALQVDDQVIAQSLAILEYLEELHPEPPLLPPAPIARAQVRSLAYNIAMDIHPLNNLRVQQYLANELQVDAAKKQQWYQHWIDEGFSGIERTLSSGERQGPYCFGASITLADVCLVPQVYNAIRFKCDISAYPRIRTIYHACTERPDFYAAAPEQQADAT